MENDDIVNIVTQLYQAVSGDEQAARMNIRIRNGVEAALKIRDVDSDLFHGLVAVGLVEAKAYLRLSPEGCRYADMLVRHFCEKSSYMKD